VELACLAGDALGDDLGVFVNKDGHVYLLITSLPQQFWLRLRP
jgi:hypothetical protein